jgi:hypothetical protein
MVVGTVMAADADFKPGTEVFGITAYTAIWAFALNLVVTLLVTLALRAAGQTDDGDDTTPEDYEERGEITEDEARPTIPDDDRVLTGQRSPRAPAGPETR